MSSEGGTVHVLLVEDNEVDVEGVRRAFAKTRVANPIHVARDGVEALAMLRGEGGRDPLPRPYLVLLDLNLPRMGGHELLEAIRSDPQLEDSIVFVLTTSKSEEDKARSYQLHVAGYMVKEHVGRDFLRVVDMLGCYWRVVELPTERP